MKTVKVKNLNKGDVVLINQSLELVTDTYDHTFYSAPILEQIPSYTDDPLRSSSHWVGLLEMDDEVILFDDIHEAIDHIRTQYIKLTIYYSYLIS